MNYNIRPLLLSLLLILTLPAIAHAQSTLEKIAKAIEDNPACETSIYREKRDPETRKVISSEFVVSFSDEKIADRIIEAFKKERQNAVSYSVDNSGKRFNNRFYQIEFEDKKGAWSSYSLIFYSRSEKWTFSVKTSIYGNPENKSRPNGKNRGKAVRSSHNERIPDYIITQDNGDTIKVFLDNNYCDDNVDGNVRLLVSAD